MREVLRRAVEHNVRSWPGMRRQFLSDPHPDPHNWGNKWQARGRYEEAEPLCRQGLEIRHGLREPVA